MKYLLITLVILTSACTPKQPQGQCLDNPKTVYMNPDIVGKCFSPKDYTKREHNLVVYITKIKHDTYVYKMLGKKCAYNNPNNCIFTEYSTETVLGDYLYKVIEYNPYTGELKNAKCP